MGHKFFRVKLIDEPEKEYPFGHVVTSRFGWFFTVHAAMKPRHGCDFCGKTIEKGEAYVRCHTLRDEFYHKPYHGDRCMVCINKGILPLVNMQKLEIFEREKRGR